MFDDKYNQYLEDHKTEAIHKGYFSVDKKGKLVDSISKTKSEKQDSTDISAYDLIMKNKERLLSFNEPTRFIFSHSALREGWDNPNVFQICTFAVSPGRDDSLQKAQGNLPIRSARGRLKFYPE